MRVRAKETPRPYAGFYNNVRRRGGDVFDLIDIPLVNGEHPHFSETWMEKVSKRVPKTPAPGEPTKEDLIADGIIPEKKKAGRPRKEG